MKKILLSIIAMLSIFSCAPMASLPAIDEPVDEIDAAPIAENLASKTSQLQTDMNLRTLKSGILEFVIELPAGTQIQVSDNYQVYLNEFRNSNGDLARSSTGFVSPVKILGVPAAYQAQFTKAAIQKLNATSTGLFISASTLVADETSAGTFAVITPATNGAGFLKNFGSNGKPRFSFTNKITTRFGARLNKGIDPLSLPVAQRTKWNAVYNELKKTANRTVAAPKSYLIMADNKAEEAFLSFEKNYVVPKYGAWTIATRFTAVKHGFANVPCAEFQSEVIRQAFSRAGYNILNDFSSEKGNLLFWNKTASVKGLSDALYKGGWVPWTTNKFKAPTGAIMFHGSGLSPGHTFTNGGDEGRIIVDNGAPQGRDLRKTTERTIEIQYQAGLFFLPPGINPEAW